MNKCLECNNKFDDMQALREDQKDANKRFGCPHCGTFYIKESKPSTRRYLVFSLFLLGITGPAFSLVVQSIKNDAPNWLLTNSTIIFVSAVILGLMNMYDPLVRSGFKRDVNREDE